MKNITSHNMNNNQPQPLKKSIPLTVILKFLIMRIAINLNNNIDRLYVSQG